MNHLRITPALAAGLLGLAIATPAQAQFERRNLVAHQAGLADFTDPNLVNPWGVAFNPTGFVWVSNRGTATSTLYNGLGQPQTLVVDIPTSSSLKGGPATGIVFYGGPGFTVTDGAGASGASRFIFAGADGVISGWAPGVPAPAPSRQAFKGADRSASGASYLGLAQAGDRLYAADFKNGRIDSFDSAFAPLALSFADDQLPADYAPSNIQALGGKLYVTYAQRDAAGNEVAGTGLGRVNVFTTDGQLEQRLLSGGGLNAPWGLAIAPAGFGALAGSLLVGNAGDGLIHAFNPITGAPPTVLTDAAGNPIRIAGLRGLAFGNGVQQQPLTTLFFAAGDDDSGVYGRIDAIPAPGPASVLAVSLLGLARRRR